MSSTWEIREGDALTRLREMPPESVQCCVTSPPYFGLRDYGADGQIGLEATPDEYVARLVGVFREVRRVLRADGTLWLNIGDSYTAGAGSRNGLNGSGLKRNVTDEATRLRCLDENKVYRAESQSHITTGVKPKDLLMIPAQLALALRADGWYLRSDIIWAKPNPMPESVTDRPTSAHEHVFLLAKSARYFYDADAIREAQTDNPGGAAFYARKGLPMPDYDRRLMKAGQPREGGNDGLANQVPTLGVGRNKRNVWEIATQPYSEAHFATFPPKLIEPCILAGSAPGNVVLDPFAGSGTTGVVALRHDRSFIGVELSAVYCEIARWRIRDDAPLLNTITETAA